MFTARYGLNTVTLVLNKSPAMAQAVSCRPFTMEALVCSPDQSISVLWWAK